MNDAATFRAQLDTAFDVVTEQGQVTLKLVDVNEPPPQGGVRQFTLLLHGPPAAVLPQGTYELRHEKLGNVIWFMVPIAGSNHERIVYQVCFSSLNE